MTSLRNLLSAGFAVAAMMAVAPAHADDQDVIDYREHIMKALNEHSAVLGQMMSMSVPDDGFALHLEALALTAQTALKAFEQKIPGGEARPEIWTNWADFSKKMNEFSKKTAEAAKLAKEKGREAVTATLVDALNCKSCHDLYRKEKK